MGRMLKDGESRRFKVGADANSKMSVVAERVDSDTPYVHVESSLGRLTLTDVEAAELGKAIEQALRVLPTSK